MQSATTSLTKIEGGIGAVPGVKLGAVRAGIKATAPADKLDLAIIAFNAPQIAAAQITTNEIKAAPLLVSEAHLQHNFRAMRAVVANSGCANACTGERGMQDAATTAKEAALALGIPPEAVIVASTGRDRRSATDAQNHRGAENAHLAARVGSSSKYAGGPSHHDD